MTVLLVFVGLFGIGALGLLAYEITRYELAKEQLRTCVNAASLAAASTLALSTDPADVPAGQTAALNIALDMFRRNSVLGIPLTSATMQPSTPLSPTGNNGQLAIQFLNKSSIPVAAGDPTGRAIRISGAFGVVPVFGKFLGIGDVICAITADAGVPMLDIVNCFDVGASMDDDTQITLVRRSWDPSTGKIKIEKVPKDGGSGMAEGMLYSVFGAPPSGIDVQGCNPQRLDNAQILGTSHYQFNKNLRAIAGPPNFLNGSDKYGYFAVDDVGAPPGNLVDSSVPVTGFTDLVVNIDGNASFAGCTYNGFSFPDLATLVEASRGNLETPATVAAAKSATVTSVSPRIGYQEAYFDAATAALKPYDATKSAVLDFNDQLRKQSNAKIGLVTFNHVVGQSMYYQTTFENTAFNYAGGGSSNHDLPYWAPIVIDNALYNLIKTRVVLQHNYGVSAYSPAIDKAVDAFSDPGVRPNSAKAIVFVTNSAPDVSQYAAMKASAARARDIGVPIYVVALATRPELESGQIAIFNDNSATVSGVDPGICGISGHGARFFQVHSEAELKNCFGNVARNLVQLVR